MPLRSSTFRLALAERTRPFNLEHNPFAARYYEQSIKGSLPILTNEQLQERRNDPFEFLAERAHHLGTGLQIQTGKPIIVEIGCHKGTLLLQMAKDFPEYNFIGLDITFKRIMMTAERIERAQLHNVAVALANASLFDTLFAEASLAGIIVFFPDPWPKRGHQKHRLVSQQFCQAARVCLKQDGFFWLKTDSFSYFDDARCNLQISGLAPVAPELPIMSRGYSSTFERHFRASGQAIAEGAWLKMGDI